MSGISGKGFPQPDTLPVFHTLQHAKAITQNNMQM